MKKDELNDYIKDLGEKAYKRLQSLDIPPYPKYYQDSFKDLLTENKNKELDSILRNNSYLIESINNDKDIYMSDQCYDIAKKSIKEFSKTNENIKKSSIDLNRVTKDLEGIDNTKLLQSFGNFQKNLINTLKEADKTILKLQEEILQLEKESNIDPLTKLYNKRALLKDLEKILELGKEKDLDLSLAIFDLDDFKKVNDKYGHIAGDKTLIYVGKAIRNCLRNEVKAYRFGGEEFVILLNRISLEDAQKIADRIIKIIGDSKLIYKNNTIHITLSGGVTSHHKGDTPDSILERADKALYEAKNNGKNRVIVE